MSDIPSFPYSILWEERSVVSVANLTRRDGLEFMAEAAATPLRVSAESLPLEEAETALSRLRAGEVDGALVLVP
jgi:propanol-preferring alcohol dehydrogenase